MGGGPLHCHLLPDEDDNHDDDEHDNHDDDEHYDDDDDIPPHSLH